jgi:hypothetical protein
MTRSGSSSLGLAGGVLASLLAVGLTAPPAAADPGTGRLRTIDCGAAGTLTVELGPAQFLTTTSAAIHVVGTNQVLVPERVVIVLPDGSMRVTLDKQAGSAGAREQVTCSYTDPAGRVVTITGVLSR